MSDPDGPRGRPRPRDALFDLALERAEAYLRRARRPTSTDPAAIRRALEVWSLKTRFASRFDLDAIAEALAERARLGATVRDDASEPPPSRPEATTERPDEAQEDDDETPAR